MSVQTVPASGARVTGPADPGYHRLAVAGIAHAAPERGAPIGEVAPLWRVIEMKPFAARRSCLGVDRTGGRRSQEGLPL
ncbi:hypothetical protein [Nitratireductor alexandrii]|uniref:hypothetical protein n=1 Tax=Nitratireductor alexandrii TaxID=2448161 RepID=UPI000FDAC2C2|nr:hypothetical protein [Nitratireductor alexandrii]